MSNCEDPTKKFINKHDEVVDDALRGLTDFNPSATLLPVNLQFVTGKGESFRTVIVLLFEGRILVEMKSKDRIK